MPSNAKTGKHGGHIGWALNANYDSSGVDTVKSVGLTKHLDLPGSCADFYLLERLEANGRPRAAEALRELEAKLAKEFRIYMNLACGGELRHMPNVCEEREECGYCYGEGRVDCGYCDGEGRTECWDCDGYETVTCQACDGSGEQEGDDEESEPCEDCDGEGQVPCGTCDGDGYLECQECDGYGREECDECYGDGYIGEESDWEEYVPTKLLPFFQTVSGGRTGAWKDWVDFREANGPKATDWMAEAFDAPCWPEGYGGPAWASIAHLLADKENGRISDRVFINMAWSQQHNGGSLFNKVYYTDYLSHALEEQATGDYVKLAKKYASPEVEGEYLFWEVTAASCAAGKRVIDQYTHYELERQGYMLKSEMHARGLFDGD